MLRISRGNNGIRVNGEVIGNSAFQIIFKEALGLTAFAALCKELDEKGVVITDLSPGVRGVPLEEKISRAEAMIAIRAISDSHETVGETVDKLGEVMDALTAPTLMAILQLIAAKETD